MVIINGADEVYFALRNCVRDDENRGINRLAIPYQRLTVGDLIKRQIVCHFFDNLPNYDEEVIRATFTSFALKKTTLTGVIKRRLDK